MKRTVDFITAKHRSDLGWPSAQPSSDAVVASLKTMGLPPRKIEQIRATPGLLDTLAGILNKQPQLDATAPLASLTVGGFVAAIKQAGLTDAAIWLLALYLAEAPTPGTVHYRERECEKLLNELQSIDDDLFDLLNRYVGLGGLFRLENNQDIELLQKALRKFHPLFSKSSLHETSERVDRQVMRSVAGAVAELKISCAKDSAAKMLDSHFQKTNAAVTAGLTWCTAIQPHADQGFFHRQLRQLQTTTEKVDYPELRDMDKFWSGIEQTQQQWFHGRAEVLISDMKKAGVEIKLWPQGEDLVCDLTGDVTVTTLNMFVDSLFSRIREGELFRGKQFAAYVKEIYRRDPSPARRSQQLQLCLAALENDPSLASDDVFVILLASLGDVADRQSLLHTARNRCYTQLRSECMSRTRINKISEAEQIFKKFIRGNESIKIRTVNKIDSWIAEAELASNIGIRIARDPTGVNFHLSNYASFYTGDAELFILKKMLALVKALLRRQDTSGAFKLTSQLLRNYPVISIQRQLIQTFGVIAAADDKLAGPNFNSERQYVLTLARMHHHGYPIGQREHGLALIIEKLAADTSFDPGQEAELMRQQLPPFASLLVKERPTVLTLSSHVLHLFGLADEIGSFKTRNFLLNALERRKDEPSIARIRRSINQQDRMRHIVQTSNSTLH